MESSSRPDWREERYGAFDEALLLAEQHQSSAADEPIGRAVAATGASVASDDARARGARAARDDTSSRAWASCSARSLSWR